MTVESQVGHPARKRARLVTRLDRVPGVILSLAFGLCTLAGCHKKPQQSARVPPPPTTQRQADVDDADGRVVGDRGRAPIVRVPPVSPGGSLPSMEVHGLPFATEMGIASWYGPPYAGRKGADGTVYDQNAMTAAHLTLALGTVVRVTNLANGQSAVVRITDRGPFVRGRIIDLSLRAAKEIGVYRAGTAKVRVEAFNAPALKPNVLPGGRWCVQIGAFPTEEDALQEKADLLTRYPGAKVLQFAGPTGHWVRINPKVADRQHAAEIADGIHLPDAAQPYLVRTD